MQRTGIGSIVFVGAICLALLTSKSAQADGGLSVPYEPRIVPKCLVYQMASGLDVCGYTTLKDVQKLYDADNDLISLRFKHAQLLSRQGNLKAIQKDLRAALKSQRKTTKILKTENARLFNLAIERDRLYQRERAKPRWGSGLSWALSAALTAALVGFVGHAALN